MSARKRRRADGTLRPSYARHRQRRRALRGDTGWNDDPERQAWLQQFEPGARTRFFVNVRERDAVFLRAFAAELALPQEEAAPLLERLANERHWMKLRTRDGMVVGIAPPRKPYRKVGRLLTRAELLERQNVPAPSEAGDPHRKETSSCSPPAA